MIAGVLAGAALLLVAAGAGKVADPSRTVGALRALRWPASSWLVRAGGVAETVLGVAVLVVGGPALALLVAASYLGFAAFVLVALSSGAPIGTCGCFARADTEPSSRHVVVVALLALGSLAAGVTDAPALLDASWPAWIMAPVVAASAYGVLTMQWPAQAPARLLDRHDDVA